MGNARIFSRRRGGSPGGIGGGGVRGSAREAPGANKCRIRPSINAPANVDRASVAAAAATATLVQVLWRRRLYLRNHDAKGE